MWHYVHDRTFNRVDRVGSPPTAQSLLPMLDLAMSPLGTAVLINRARNDMDSWAMFDGQSGVPHQQRLLISLGCIRPQCIMSFCIYTL